MKSDPWWSGSKVRLFKLLGITFQIDLTWMIVLTLMTFSLASQFSKEYPHWSSVHYWSAGVVTCLLFFTSIVFHELAHSVVAKVAGLPVQSITLFILGGISQIGKEVQRPGIEFLVAVAGPAASVALSVLFGLIWTASRGHWEMAGALAEWLMQINLLLALFNLIPSFPLDGGRILRAAVWGLSGSFSKGTRVALVAGKGFAFVFFAGAVALMVSGQLVYGFWIMFIGWFLWVASRQTERQLQFRNALKGFKAADLVVRNCPRVEIGASVAVVAEGLSANRAAPCFLVMENGGLKGLVGRNHLNAVPPERWTLTAVEDIMSPIARLRWVRPDHDMLRVLEIMDREEIQYVSVVEQEGWLVGVLGRQEILHLMKTRFQATA